MPFPFFPPPRSVMWGQVVRGPGRGRNADNVLVTTGASGPRRAEHRAV